MVKRQTYSDATQGDSSHLFTDPSLTKALDDDPVLQYLKSSWRVILVIAIAVGAVWYGREVFQNTRQASIEAASQSFTKLRADYTEYVDSLSDLKALQSKGVGNDPKSLDDQKKALEAGEKRVADAKARVQEQLRVVGDSTTEPYVSLAKLYSGLTAVASGSISEGKQILSSFPLNSDTPDKERLFAEGAVYRLGRLLLDEQPNEGRTHLMRLVNEGKYFHVASALTLSRIARTDEERATALAILEKIRNDQPAQGKVLDPEIKMLKP